jgi:hypothetical protein
MFDFNEKLCFCYYATSLPFDRRRLVSMYKVTRYAWLLFANLWEKDALKVNFFSAAHSESSCISEKQGKTARNAIN